MKEIQFKNSKPNQKKLREFGFCDGGEELTYSELIVDGQMELTVIIKDRKVFTRVTDVSTNEEYVLHGVAGSVGAFVGRVRASHDAVLEKIVSECFDCEIFKNTQTKAVMKYIEDTYGDTLEYLWQKFPNNAVVRRKDNKKWYVAILTVVASKLGLSGDEIIEIIDLRINPDEMQNTVDNKKYFAGYHMNKKHWITVCLDGTVENDELFKRIDDSYRLAK